FVFPPARPYSNVSPRSPFVRRAHLRTRAPTRIGALTRRSGDSRESPVGSNDGERPVLSRCRGDPQRRFEHLANRPRKRRSRRAALRPYRYADVPEQRFALPAQSLPQRSEEPQRRTAVGGDEETSRVRSRAPSLRGTERGTAE